MKRLGERTYRKKAPCLVSDPRLVTFPAVVMYGESTSVLSGLFLEEGSGPTKEDEFRFCLGDSDVLLVFFFGFCFLSFTMCPLFSSLLPSIMLYYVGRTLCWTVGLATDRTFLQR